ncbi:MAG: T9SS type A sorting domain-containing protein [Bacteroidales bacterium]|nr:T9SS type A sorting domain-containing protein [Bacteroidales bacterium]
MKTILTFIAVIVSFSIYSQNHPLLTGVESFESWEKSEAGDLPKFWDGFNREIVMGGFPVGIITTVFRDSTYAYDGSSAVILQSQPVMGGAAVPGILTTGALDIDFVSQTGDITGGLAYSSRPNFFRGFLKCFPASGDTAVITVTFKNQGVEIGGGFLLLPDSITSWSQFSVPISFSSTVQPDTVLIFISTSTKKANVPFGSQLHIDKVGFDLASSINNPSSNLKAKIFPNPSTDMLQIELDSQNPVQLAIFDSFGKNVMQLPDYQSNEVVDISYLPGGIYFIRILGYDFELSQKLIVQ